MKKLRTIICTMLISALLLPSFSAMAEEDYTDAKWTDIPIPTYSADSGDISKRSEKTIIGFPQYSDIDEDSLLHSVQLLETLSIMKGFEDGTFKPDNQISRGECAYIIMKMLNKTPDINAKKYFYDVPSSHAMYGAISTLADCGIIGGYGNGSFRPDEPATGGELLVMAVNAIGGSAIAQQFSDGRASYSTVARDLGFLDGVHLSDKLTRSDTAKIIYNVLNSNVYAISYTNGSISYTKDNGRTFLEEVYDIYRAEGKVTANSITALYGTKTKKNHISVGSADFEISNVVFNDLLGKYIDFYYLKTDTDKRIIYAFEKSGGEELILHAKDITEYKDGRIYYRNESGNTRSVKIADVGKKVILNSECINDYEGEIFKQESGTVRLVKTHGESEYNVIFIETFQNSVLKSMSGADGKITMQMQYDVPALEIDTTDESLTAELFNENGNRMDFSMTQSSELNADGIAVSVVSLPPISDGAVLSIWANKTENRAGKIVPAPDATYIKIIVNEKSVTGKVNSLYSDSDGDYATIDDTEYMVAKSNFLNEKDNILRNKDIGTFLFDADGNIAAWTPSNPEEISNDWQYGYLIKAKYNEDYETVKLHIMDINGEKLDYTTYEKIKINDERKVDAYAIIDYLKEKAKLLDTTMTDVSQPIKYMVGNETEITKLQTVMASTGIPQGISKDQFNRTGARRKLSSKENTGWALNVSVYSNRNEPLTPGMVVYGRPKYVFAVPEQPTGNDNDYDIFSMPSWAEEVEKTIEVFDCDDMRYPNLAVLYEAVDPQPIFDGYVMVDKVVEALDESEDLTYKISVCTGVKMAEYTVDYSDADILKKTITYKDGSQKTRLIQKGDLIKVYGKKNNVKLIEMIIPIDNLPEIATSTPGYGDETNQDGTPKYGKNLGGTYVFNFAEVLRTDNRDIVMQSGAITSGVDRSYQRLINWTNNNAVMKYGAITYDAEAGTVSISNGPNELKSVTDYGTSMASKIFTYEKFSDFRQIVVYNNVY